MTYTVKSKEHSKFDINKRCAELMGIAISFSRLPEKVFKLSVDSGGFTDEYNPCNNPQDTWPIIEKCWDDLNESTLRSGGRRKSHWQDKMQQHNCTKLVAACICFIELGSKAMIDQPLLNNAPEGEPEGLEAYELKQRIAEFESQIKYLMEDCRVFNINELEEHNLYMQAKGIEDFIEVYPSRGAYGQTVYESGLKSAIELRKQARR